MSGGNFRSQMSENCATPVARAWFLRQTFITADMNSPACPDRVCLNSFKKMREFYSARHPGRTGRSARAFVFTDAGALQRGHWANRASRRNSSSVSVFKNAINLSFSSAESGMPKVPSDRRSKGSRVGESFTPAA